jgi:hypothetical protein
MTVVFIVTAVRTLIPTNFIYSTQRKTVHKEVVGVLGPS